jgi:hypothetical protein
LFNSRLEQFSEAIQAKVDQEWPQKLRDLNTKQKDMEARFAQKDKQVSDHTVEIASLKNAIKDYVDLLEVVNEKVAL